MSTGSRFGLVSFDVDGTIFRQPALTTVSDDLGIGVKWHRYDDMFLHHRITLGECLDKQFRLLSGLRLDLVLKLVSKVETVRNVRETVEKLQGHGLRVVLLTNNPDFLCAYLVDRFGFDGYVSSKIPVRDGVIGKDLVSMPEKLDGMKRYSRWTGVSLDRCAHIGDWINDIPVFQAVGYSIAFNAKQDRVKKAASCAMESDDLLAVYQHLLPMISQ